MDSIRLKNYRCFSDTGDVSIKPLTFLLGANSSGKSSFLEFFPLLKQSSGVRRNGVFLWYANDVDFKDFRNALKSGEESMDVSWTYSDFAPTSDRLSSRVGKFLRGRKIIAKNVELRLSMSLSSRKDNYEKLDCLKVEFYDNVIVLKIDSEGKVAVVINGRVIDGRKLELRLVNTPFLLPRVLARSINKASGETYSSLWSQDEPFTGGLMKDIKGALRYESFVFLSKNDYLSLFGNLAAGENLDYEYMRDLYLLYNLDDIFETINYRIHAEAFHMFYVKPLRVMTERYYRYQNYSVDDIESDGKNLAMFLANLTPGEVNDFQNWTNKYFGFKIYPIKHEGHIELTIGKSKKEARNLVDVGFGYTQLLPIITIIWNAIRGKRIPSLYPGIGNPPIVIAIEQPELHLHPKIQSLFAEVVAKVIEDLPSSTDVRFIIETHSESIINRIGSMIQAKELARDKVNVVMFNGVKEGLEDFVVEAEFDQDGYLSKWPLGFFN